MGRLRRAWHQAGLINAGPTANLLMRSYAVMARDAVRIQRSVPERLDDRLFINRNSHPCQAVGGSSRQSVRQNDRFHSKENMSSKFKNHEKQHGKAQSFLAGWQVGIPQPAGFRNKTGGCP
jgi:hypothetical protein